MSERVSGWVAKSSIAKNCLFNDLYAPEVSPHIIHVTEVPEGAIEGEADVSSIVYANGDYCGKIDLPTSLIGKRVRYIIFEEDKA